MLLIRHVVQTRQSKAKSAYQAEYTSSKCHTLRASNDFSTELFQNRLRGIGGDERSKNKECQGEIHVVEGHAIHHQMAKAPGEYASPGLRGHTLHIEIRRDYPKEISWKMLANKMFGKELLSTLIGDKRGPKLLVKKRRSLSPCPKLYWHFSSPCRLHARSTVELKLHAYQRTYDQIEAEAI